MNALTNYGLLVLASNIAFAAPALAANPRIPIFEAGPNVALAALVSAPARDLGSYADFLNSLTVTKNEGHNAEKREATADPSLTIWQADPKLAAAAIAAQATGIPPHASGPGKPAYVDYHSNPNVIKNEGPRKTIQKGQQAQKREAVADAEDAHKWVSSLDAGFSGKSPLSYKEWIAMRPESAPYKRAVEPAPAANERHVPKLAEGPPSTYRVYERAPAAGGPRVQKFPGRPAPDKRAATPDASSDVPPQATLDKRSIQEVKEAAEACLVKHNFSGGLAWLREELTARHIEEVEAELRDRGAEDCILTAFETLKTTGTNGSEVTQMTQITTQTTASEPVAAAAAESKVDEEMQGNQNAGHGLAPPTKRPGAHNLHPIIDHGEHDDGSEHDAVKEAQEAEKRMEKRERREKRLLWIPESPQKKDLPKHAWIGVDGVMF